MATNFFICRLDSKAHLHLSLVGKTCLCVTFSKPPQFSLVDGTHVFKRNLFVLPAKNLWMDHDFVLLSAFGRAPMEPNLRVQTTICASWGTHAVPPGPLVVKGVPGIAIYSYLQPSCFRVLRLSASSYSRNNLEQKLP